MTFEPRFVTSTLVIPKQFSFALLETSPFFVPEFVSETANTNLNYLKPDLNAGKCSNCTGRHLVSREALAMITGI